MSFGVSYPTQPLTDEQLRATPLPVSVIGGEINIENASLTVDLSAFLPTPDSVLMVGTVDGTEEGMKAVLQVDLDGVLAVNGSQFTQPISALALPLPDGAATAGLQTSGNAILTTINAALAGTLGISGTVAVSNFPVTQPISAAALPLPAGAATETTLALLNGKVAAVDTNDVTITAMPAITGTVAVSNFPAAGLTDTELRATPVPVSGTVTANAGTNLNTSALALEATLGTRLSESDFDTKIGSLTEGAPGTDTASSGLNGRLQRIAQRLTSLIALLPATLGQKTMANSLAVVLASDQASIPVAATQSGTWTEANSAAQLTALQLIDDTIGTVAAAIPTKGIAALGTDGTNGRVLKTDASGELQVDVLTLPAITGTVGVNNFPATQAVSLASLPALATGANVIGAVTQSGAWSVAVSSIPEVTFNSRPIYFYNIPSQVHVAAANAVHWDLFNADATAVVRVISVIQIPNVTTAVTGIVFDWKLARTTSVGTGGSAQTAWLADTTDTALDADITCRSKPAGGASEGTILRNYSLSSEETSPATIQIASQGGLELVPFALQGYSSRKGIILRQNQGIRCVQITNSNAGNTGWLIAFTVE